MIRVRRGCCKSTWGEEREMVDLQGKLVEATIVGILLYRFLGLAIDYIWKRAVASDYVTHAEFTSACATCKIASNKTNNETCEEIKKLKRLVFVVASNTPGVDKEEIAVLVE
jgi:hypothetical protein